MNVLEKPPVDAAVAILIYSFQFGSAFRAACAAVTDTASVTATDTFLNSSRVFIVVDTQNDSQERSTEGEVTMSTIALLWSPYGIGQTIIFLPCGFFLSSFFLSSPNLSTRTLDVYHTSTHNVALVRI